MSTRPTFVHVGRLPGRNEQDYANRANRYCGASMKKSYGEEVGWSIVKYHVPRFTGDVRIDFVWHEPPAPHKDGTSSGKRRDLDNIAAADKIILDAMVKKLVIKDDSLVVHTGHDLVREEFGQSYGVEVYIEEVERGNGWDT